MVRQAAEITTNRNITGIACGCPECGKLKDIEDFMASFTTPDGNGTSELCRCSKCGCMYIDN